MVRNNRRRIEIDPSLMEDDKEMLEDLIAAAFNDAVRRAEELQKEKMASVTAGMPLPPGMKLPFEFIGCVNLSVHTPSIFSIINIMQSSPLLEHLIENLRCLPGVGPKSSAAHGLSSLQRNRSGGMNLARALTEAMSKIGHCSSVVILPKRKRAIFVTILVVKIQVCFVWWKCRRIFKPIGAKQASFLGVILS